MCVCEVVCAYRHQKLRLCVYVCVCLVFAQIVRAKSCVNICVKNFSERGLKTFPMLPGYADRDSNTVPARERERVRVRRSWVQLVDAAAAAVACSVIL